MRIRRLTTSLLIGLCLFGLNGCGEKPVVEKANGEHADEHAHAVEGPHGGHIIELGAEDHHAELTHDKATNKVGVYLLGADAKTPAPIEAKEVMINVSVDGQGIQYVLPAAAQTVGADGKASYFEIESEPLCKIVLGESESKNTQARISIKDGDKPYVGMIETSPHDHDHNH